MTLKKHIRNNLLYLFFFIISQVNAQTISPDLQSALDKSSPDENLSVIVYLSNQPMKIIYDYHHKKEIRENYIKALKQYSESEQKNIKDFLIKKGVKKVISLWMINALSIEVNKNIIYEISNMKNVELIDINSVITLPENPPSKLAAVEWNLQAINVQNIWNLGFSGEGIVVANMDTGVDIYHEELKNKWRGGSNSWYDPNNQHASPHDSNGHGTETMGIILGGDPMEIPIGVAPSAKWISVKIFNDDDQSTKEIIHLGFQWLLDPDANPSTDDAPDIVNNSWGLEYNANKCILDYKTDIQALKNAGIGVVFSCGNTGPSASSSISPANYPESFSVGATDINNAILMSSARGPSACISSIYPLIVAPGVNIKTTGLTAGGVFPHYYSYVSGTSFAAPHVTGAMALLLSAFPDSNISELESVLMNTASDLGDAGPDNTFGYGLLDIEASYNILKNIYARKTNLWVIY